MATKKATKKATAARKAASTAAKRNVPQSTAVALPSTAIALQGVPEGFKATRALQLPILVLKVPGEGRALAFLGPLRISTVAPKKEEEAYATVATVADTSTGEQMNFLVPAVVESVLQDTFSDVRERPDRKDYEARGKVYQSMNLTDRVFFIRNDGKKNKEQRHVDFTVIEGEAVTMTPAGGSEAS